MHNSQTVKLVAVCRPAPRKTPCTRDFMKRVYDTAELLQKKYEPVRLH